MSSQTIKTLASLLNEQPDNLSRLISPQDMRDLTATVFGPQVTFDPTLDDDELNSGGNGFFDAGQWWLNTTARKLWYCMSGSPHAATWKLIFPQSTGSSTLVMGTYPIVVTEPVTGVFNVSYPSSFNPGLATGLVVWLEQDGTLYQDAAGTIPVTNGSPVGKWMDLSTSHNDFTRFFADSFRPTFIAGAYGDLNAIRFAGSHEMSALVPALNSLLASTWFLVVNFSSTGNSNTVCLGVISGDKLLGQQSGGPRWLTSWSSGNAYDDHGASLDSLHVSTRRNAGTGGTIAVDMAGWFDGVQETLTPSGVSPASIWGTTADVFLGGISGGGDMTGDVLALLIYDRALSDAEVDAVNAYLTNKYLGTSVPPVQSVRVASPLLLFGPPWALTIVLGAVPTSLLSLDTWPLSVIVPAVSLGVGYPYSDLSGAPTLPAFQCGFSLGAAYGTGPTTFFTMSTALDIQGRFEVENLSGSLTARLVVTVNGPRFGVQSHFLGLGGPGNWSGSIEVPQGLAAFGIIVEMFTDIQIDVDGNGTAGTCNVRWDLTGC